MTIPALIENNNEKETVLRLKKAYNILAQAYNLSIMQNNIDSFGYNAATKLEGSKNLMDKFEPYLKIIKRCDGTKGCYSKNSDTDNRTDISKVILADGMSFYTYSPGNFCTNVYGTSLALKNVCGSINIDINGLKEPNQPGKDIFVFYVTKRGIIPLGTPEETFYPMDKNCPGGFSNDCAAWVLFNENLDYPPNGVGWK